MEYVSLPTIPVTRAEDTSFAFTLGGLTLRKAHARAKQRCIDRTTLNLTYQLSGCCSSPAGITRV
jgi:hypothetical protein